MPTHSTPVGVVVEYFNTLRWLARSAHETTDSKHARRLAALSTILAVTAVEVFLNLWFRMRVAECGSDEWQDELLRDFRRKISLERKFSKWPKKFLGVKLNAKSGAGKNFVMLKNMRNSIAHFESTHETIHAPGMIIHGLADTTVYDALSAARAKDALTIAEAFVEEIFQLAGVTNEGKDVALAVWLGEHRTQFSIEAASQGLPLWLVPHVER